MEQTCIPSTKDLKRCAIGVGVSLEWISSIGILSLGKIIVVILESVSRRLESAVLSDASWSYGDHMQYYLYTIYLQTQHGLTRPLHRLSPNPPPSAPPPSSPPSKSAQSSLLFLNHWPLKENTKDRDGEQPGDDDARPLES